MLGIDWKRTILTPPFPSYVSEHATLIGAAPVYLQERKAASDAMAIESAISRLFGGSNFRIDNEDGLA